MLSLSIRFNQEVINAFHDEQRTKFEIKFQWSHYESTVWTLLFYFMNPIKPNMVESFAIKQHPFKYVEAEMLNFI